MFDVQYAEVARRHFRKMPPNLTPRISEKIVTVAADPVARHPNVKRLRVRDGYRLRVGDWRILYSLDMQAKMLTVEAVETRGDAYR